MQRLLDTHELRAALAAGQLAPQTLVWRRGLAHWVRAESLDELTKAPVQGMHVPIPDELGPKAPPSLSIPEPRALDDTTARGKRLSNVVDLVALDSRGRSKPTLMGIGDAALDPTSPEATPPPTARASSRGGASRPSSRGNGSKAPASVLPRSYAPLVPVPPRIPTLSDPEETVTRVRNDDATSVAPRPSQVPAAPSRENSGAASHGAASHPSTPAPSAPPPSPVSGARTSVPARPSAGPPRRRPQAPPPPPPTTTTTQVDIHQPPVAMVDVVEPSEGGPVDASLNVTGPLPTLVSMAPEPDAVAATSAPRRQRPKTEPFPALTARTASAASAPVDESFLGVPPANLARVSPPRASAHDEAPTSSAPPLPRRRWLKVGSPSASDGTGFHRRARALAVTVALVGLAFGAGRGSAISTAAPAVRPARAGWVGLPLFSRAVLAGSVRRPCLMQAAPSRWASKAARSVPFDAAPVGEGALALGYARSSDEPRGLVLDLDTGTVQKTHEPEGETPKLSRVSPLIREGEVVFEPVVAESEGLAKAVILRADRPMRVGVAGDELALVTDPGAAPRPLWKLPGAIERLQVTPLGPSARGGFGVVYLANERVWYGAARTDGTTLVEPTALESEAKVGKPMLSSDGRLVSVVFAEGTSGEVPVRLRWARGEVDKALTEAPVVELPSGGPGGDAIAPDVAALPGGRWLLLWTEGREGDRALRAQTYDAGGHRLGSALRVSPETGNFGQGMVAVVGERAAVAFLLKTDSYQLWGTVLQCR
ncbi:MAG: DUF4339 domain-containing protein [Deltaproteobacteria bacterium]|nr:DUF4339 domain-containing protein [Deltaproteobacteria bacterium]